nr:zinc ribbon domain-containing protein [Actinomycetota bacterium]
FLEDARERELEIKAAELRVRQLSEQSCGNCGYPIEKNFLRCPNCQRRLKDPCPTCSKPVDPRWSVCPFCETNLRGSGEERSRRQRRDPEERTASKRQDPREEGRSPRREPDPDPRQA